MPSRSLLDMIALSGFDRPQNIIHLFVGGSELHGAKVGTTDDTDLYGVYILHHAKKLNTEVEAAVSSSLLPENVDRSSISKLVGEIHLAFWK